MYIANWKPDDIGTFIIGLDVDRPGIGLHIAATANQYGLDVLNVLFLTPLPGTDLWTRMEEGGRIALEQFPEDWQYYTLTFPVARYQHLDRDEIIHEMESCSDAFYSLPGIARRVGRNLWKRQRPMFTLVGNLSYRYNGRLGQDRYREFTQTCDRLQPSVRVGSSVQPASTSVPREG
jgi:radical SAM superfamily enzyme YgiQ (UPF0313 family)